MVRDGARPLVEETGNGRTVFYQGRYLYSSKNPIASVLALINETVIPPASLVFVPSCGLGYGLPELAERLPPHCHILCLECDSELMRLAETEALPRLAGREGLTVLAAADLPSVERFFSRFPPGTFRRVIRLNLCGAARLYPEFYSRVETYLAREIQTYWQNKMTLMHMGLLYTRNLLANLPLLPLACNLDALSLDRPLVVAGAGPSLPATLPLIRSLGSRAALLAVDTALPVLLAADLIPDFVFALEPQFVNIKDFIALGAHRVPLIADLCSAPQVVRFCAEKRKCPLYFVSSEFHPLSLWGRLQAAGLRPRPIPPLGSVGVAAVYIALRLTGAPVFLAGLDFSFPFQKTHATGSPGSLLELETTDRLRSIGQRDFTFFCDRPPLPFPAKNNGRVGSDLILSSYAENLAILCQGAQRVFDLNPHGLPLGAPLVRSLAEAEAVMAATPPGNRDARGDGASDWQSNTVREFLYGENIILEAAAELCLPLIGPGAPASGRLSDEHNERLACSDYAYCHIPGKSPLPDYTKAFAAQTLLALRYFLERIRRAETLVG
jgi:hypothetical protein